MATIRKGIIRKGIVLAATFSILTSGFAGAASATTYSCDNDPTATSGCDKNIIGTWTYRSGQSNDWNKDDRLSQSNAPTGEFYTWYVNSIASGTYTVKVYLANASFTNRNAEYTGGRTNDAVWAYLGKINQYSAPSGWTTLSNSVTMYSTGKGGAEVESYDSGFYNTQTGADAIQFSN